MPIGRRIFLRKTRLGMGHEPRLRILGTVDSLKASQVKRLRAHADLNVERLRQRCRVATSVAGQ
jgi:hypothetical protein